MTFRFHHPSLRLEALRDVAVVRCTARILREETLRGSQQQLIRLMNESARRGVYLDLRDVEVPTASGLGKVVALHAQMQQAGGHLVLCNVQRMAYEVFRVAGLTDILDVQRQESPLPRREERCSRPLALASVCASAEDRAWELERACEPRP